jgi:hypothetical protein
MSINFMPIWRLISGKKSKITERLLTSLELSLPRRETSVVVRSQRAGVQAARLLCLALQRI